MVIIIQCECSSVGKLILWFNGDLFRKISWQVFYSFDRNLILWSRIVFLLQEHFTCKRKFVSFVGILLFYYLLWCHEFYSFDQIYVPLHYAQESLFKSSNKNCMSGLRILCHPEHLSPNKWKKMNNINIYTFFSEGNSKQWHWFKMNQKFKKHYLIFVIS